MHPGNRRFITFEGGEGSGKSTQLRLLAEALAARNVPHVVTREPGGTPGAESIRRLLVEGDPGQWDAMTETILFMAARVDHVRKRIIPALREGKLVLCDRFMDSTRVYQGVGKGISQPFIEMLHHFTLPNFQPDLTLILDIEPEEGLKRAVSRHGAENRFESLGLEFHRAIREGYLAIAKECPERCVIIDAGGSLDEVHSRVMEAVRAAIENSQALR